MNVLSDQNNLPGVNSDEINFHDLFEIDEVQQIQDMYSDATGVASLIIHPDGTPITRPSNFTRFCKHFTFKTEQRWAACHFAGGFKHDLSHTVNRADCLICDGLWDAGAKITVSGKHLATWIFGQVRNETSDLQRLIEDAGKAGLSSEDLPQMLNELPAMSAVQFDKVSGMLYLLANQLSQKALANLVLKKKVAEQEFTIGLLKESEERYRLLFENSGDAILFTEPNGGILTANPEACRIFDRSEEEIIEVGRNGMIDMNDPEVVIALKKREITGKFKGELNFFRKDGTIFPSEVSSSIFKDSLGNIRSSMIIHDISERKRAEVALRESEDNYRMLFNTNKDSISILRIDHNGIPANFIEANDAACELLGYTRDELFSFNIADIEVDVPRDISQKRLEALQTHGRVDFETVLKDRMGHDRILDVKVVLINYFNQPALLNITRDITDRKRAEIKLHETNAFLENLINYANAPIIVWDTHA
jgi:PAS domain S-box-containing protein